MKRIRFYFSSLILFGLGSITLQADQTASAKILSVSGSAYVQSKENPIEEKPLVADTVVFEGDILTTSEFGKVQLVFSNGSELALKENTSLLLKELSQEPFLASKAYEELEADPSKSRWALKLNYGEVSGHVKQLRVDSEFSIETEFGTALVYGTHFSMGYAYDSISNQFIVFITNNDGLVDFISRFSKGIDFGSGSSASVFFDSTGEKTQRFVPPGHHIRILQSAQNPEYSHLLKNFKSKNVKTQSPPASVFERTFIPVDQPVVSSNTPDT